MNRRSVTHLSSRKALKWSRLESRFTRESRSESHSQARTHNLKVLDIYLEVRRQ